MWASAYIQKLQNGESVSFRPRGNSMQPRINSGALVTVDPLDAAGKAALAKGDVVLCKVKGAQYLHLICAIRQETNGLRFQIGNNRGGINGWIGPEAIYGRLVMVRP